MGANAPSPPPRLFSPLRLRGLELRNRVAVAPMVTYQAEEGAVGDWHLMHLGRFAAGGAGLVMMESTKVDPDGRSTVRDVALWHDRFVPPLRRIADFVHAQGAAIGIQLGHAGRKGRSSVPWEGRAPLSAADQADRDWRLVGPSAVPHADGSPTPKPLSGAEIAALVDAWADAAARAHQAGFDVVEVHAAHGYLLHQFLSPAANRRTDSYGGSMRNRMRFPIEVAAAVRARWPAEKPLFVRISAVDEQGWTLDDSVAFARALRAVGVDLIDCSSGGIGDGASTLGGSRLLGYGYQAAYAARVRSAAGIATMAVGLIIHAAQAEAILAGGQADLVALGREMLFNPNWPIDAALKLGHAAIFEQIPRTYGFWLEKRDLGSFGGVASTWQAAPSAVGEV